MNDRSLEKNKPINMSFPYLNSYFGFGIVLFIQALNLSSIGDFYPSILTIITRLSQLITLEMVIVYLLCTKLTIRRVVILGSMVVFSIIVMFKSGTSNILVLAILLGITVFGVSIKFQDIAKLYFFTLLSVHIVITVLSLIGKLPQSGFASKVYSFQSSYQEIEYFWGYAHPNAFGTMMLILLIAFIFAFPNKKKSTKLILSLLVLALCTRVTAGTAASGALIITLGIILEPIIIRFSRAVYRISIGTMILIPIFSIWVGINSTTKIALLINRYVQSRPMIWNYYLTQFPIDFFASRLKIDLSIAGGGVIGNGVLDGSYIYVLLHWGIVALLLMLFSWFMFLKSYKQAGKMGPMLLVLGVMTVVIAFPESHMVFYYENILCLGIGLLQLNKEELAEVMTFV